MKKLITILNFFIVTVILLSSSVLANNTSVQEEAYSSIIVNAAENAIDDFEQDLKDEKKQLLNMESILEGGNISLEFEEVLNLSKSSVQIGDKLYLEYTNAEKNEIYKLMTPNAQKMFEKNTNYFKKGNYNYYDTGRLRTLPIFIEQVGCYNYIQRTSLTEEGIATYDVLIKVRDTDKIYAKYSNALKLVYKDETGEWLIDSLKFKSKVEKDDTYPEYPVIEEKVKEEKYTNNKKETSKVDENKNTTNTVKEELNNNIVVSNNTVLKESNVINNINNTLQNNANQILETGTENNNELLKGNNLLIFLICCIVIVIIVLIIVACKKVKNKANKE